MNQIPLGGQNKKTKKTASAGVRTGNYITFGVNIHQFDHRAAAGTAHGGILEVDPRAVRVGRREHCAELTEGFSGSDPYTALSKNCERSRRLRAHMGAVRRSSRFSGSSAHKKKLLAASVLGQVSSFLQGKKEKKKGN